MERRIPKIRCAPFVDRRWLLFSAGLLWSLVGISLCIVACYWLSTMDWPFNGLGVVFGFGSGILIYRHGFSKVAAKNIRRIDQKPDVACLFSFQSWKSYLLIFFMMLLGYTIRHSHLPTIVPAVIYAGIGTGLALSSSLYYEHMRT